MAGGNIGDRGNGIGTTTSSVLILSDEATTWVSIASLPRPLRNAQASVVGGKLRLNGGQDPDHAFRSEVIRNHLPVTIALYQCI